MRFLFLFLAVVAALYNPAITPSARAGALQDVSLGIGATAGADMLFGIPVASPSVSAAAELGGPHFRWYTAFDSSPTLLHSISFDLAGIPVAMISTGPTFGNEDFRIGPYATVGLVSAGAGVRALVNTRTGKYGGKLGWEARLTYTYASAVTTTVLYTWHPRLKK